MTIILANAIRLSGAAGIASAVLLLAAPAAATVFTKGSTLVPVASNMPAAVSDPQPLSAPVNLVTNGSFETGDFTGWDQFGDTSFTFVTTELAAGGPTDGDWHAAFGPLDPSGGFIVQTIATIPGKRYTFSFDLANLGGTPNAFGAIWDGSFVALAGDLPAFDYGSFSIPVTASGTATLIGFGFYNEPSFFLLDNVSVTGVIPEPATWAMMIAGFGLVGSALRRRNQEGSALRRRRLATVNA
jgi:hypothetical protein